MKKVLQLSAIAALTALAANGARAETASDSVDATAGLQPALELSCTDVSFGVWRVPVRASGSGTTTITLDASNDSVTPGGNTTRVAQSQSDASWAHSRGTCTLSGSLANEETSAAITITGNTNMAFTGANAAASGYVGLAAPTTAAALTATLSVPPNVTISGGAASFHVGGVLTIPQAIVADNYGGYKTSAAADITVDDGV